MKKSVIALFLLFWSCQLLSNAIQINEILASNRGINLDEDGDDSDWVELYNSSSEVVNLKGYFLSDDIEKSTKWSFPDVVIQPKGYLLVWLSSKDRNSNLRYLHANFSFSADGEYLLLSNASGDIIDQVPPTSTPNNISLSREIDGVGSFILAEPSPGRSNQSSKKYVAPPQFSRFSGFYNMDISLDLFHKDPNAIIVFTDDGSEPDINNLTPVRYAFKTSYNERSPYNPGIPFNYNTIQSKLFSQTISVKNRTFSPNKLTAIPSTHHNTPSYLPFIPVKKGTTIKAKAYIDGISSSTVTHSYFVSESGQFNHSIPIWSLSLDERELFDYDKGIYVAGKTYEDWKFRNQNMTTNGGSPANYFTISDSKEVEGHLQFFENGNMKISQKVGLKIHGGWSRANPVKSFRLYARKEYDKENEFKHSFFGNQNSDEFKRLVLRNSGNDFEFTYFRDALLNKMVRHLNFDTQDYQPSILYINGEYWGIHNIRERYDHHYLFQKYKIEEQDLEILENNAVVDVGGSNTHYLSLRNYIAQNNMANATAYEYVKTQMDVENFIDYQISQIYIDNRDWPGNNIKFFRKKTQGYISDAPPGQDGRWRWLFYDVDFGFGLYNSSAFSLNTLVFATATNGPNWPNPDWSTLILRRLLQNPDFKNYFINRFADLLNTGFSSQRVLDLINSISSAIVPEIDDHTQRWRNTISSSFRNWSSSIQTMRNFANLRPNYQRDHLRSFFALSPEYTLNLDVNDPAQGFVKVNTIDILPSTPGVNNVAYPWNGQYFANQLIKITAKPKPGYKFSHWTGFVESKDSILSIAPTTFTSLKAHFTPLSQKAILYGWYFDGNIANNQPLESITSTFSKNGLQSAKLDYDSCLPGYPYSSFESKYRVASLERRNDPTELNYKPLVNSGLAYNANLMRGIQVKQPFQFQNQISAIIISFSGQGFKDFEFSFAARNDGSTVSRINLEYREDPCDNWNPISSKSLLQDNYRIFKYFLPSTNKINNNPNLQLKINFNGENLLIDEGNRVTFNNMIIEGNPYEFNGDFVVKTKEDEMEGSLREVMASVADQTSISVLSTIDSLIVNKPLNFTRSIKLEGRRGKPLIIKYDFDSEFYKCSPSFIIDENCTVDLSDVHIYSPNTLKPNEPLIINNGTLRLINSTIITKNQKPLIIGQNGKLEVIGKSRIK